jgi:septal ring-binding cell division protein DamX
MFQDRRHHQRLTPNTPQLVLLDESKYSLLFDVCEGGLAIEGFAAQKVQEEFSVEFDLPGGNGCIQARAEVVWTSNSGYRTGFRFVDLDEPHREQLRTWIDGASSARLSVVEDRPAQTVFTVENAEIRPEATAEEKLPAGTTLFPLPETHPAEPNRFDSEHEPLRESRLPAYGAALLLASFMCLLAFFMGYYWRAAHSRPRVPHTAAAAAPPPKLSPGAPGAAAPPPSPQPSAPGAAALDQPGFVLQVGAMANEANADGLSSALQKKNFPAFVYQRGSDHFHRIGVGPFATKDLAAKAQRDLKAQGYNSLLKPWSPE